MSKKNCSDIGNGAVSRRIFLTTGVAGITAVTAGCVLVKQVLAAPQLRTGGSSSRKPSLSAPFDTFRDYIMALEERGLLLRFERMDQDAYEMTALLY